MTEADEPGDGHDPADLVELSAEELAVVLEDDGESSVPSWRGAIAEMIVALLAVVALIAAFIGVAVILGWLLP